MGDKMANVGACVGVGRMEEEHKGIYYIKRRNPSQYMYLLMVLKGMSDTRFVIIIHL